MNAEIVCLATFDKIKTAAGLACQLRNLLEEIGNELKDEDKWQLAWDYEDMASCVSSVEGDLDVHVEEYQI